MMKRPLDNTPEASKPPDEENVPDSETVASAESSAIERENYPIVPLFKPRTPGKEPIEIRTVRTPQEENVVESTNSDKETAIEHPENYPIVPPARAHVLELQRAHLESLRERRTEAIEKVTYHGGPLIRNVEIFALYWGSAWINDTGLASISAHLNQFFTDFVSGSGIEQLAEYSRPGYEIGSGLFRTPGLVMDDTEPPASVSDGQLQTELRRWINTYQLEQTDNSLFFIFLPPNTEVTAPWGRSCVNFCGYHWYMDGSIFYAVMPYPTCSGCRAGLTILDALKVTSSHEICEAVTDPVFKNGWWDPANDEIGDICAWKTKVVDGHRVQMEWSNADGTCK